ncbi:MAG: hypothetical protein ACYTEQ_00745 [Planctomycetota bacterium]|jgi:hypothetical protein
MRKYVSAISALLLLGCVGTFAETDIGVKGDEGGNATFYIYADQGDDAADKWSIVALAAGGMVVQQNGTTVFTFAATGNHTFANPTTNTLVTIQGFESSEARLLLQADQGDDADDDAMIAMGTDGNLDFRGTDGTNDVAVLDMSSGDLQIDGDLTITGNGLNTPGDLQITPTGTEVHINGGLAVGDTTAVGDNNAKIVGTLDQVGVATFTAESVHNGGIDADYITTDAAAGIDTKTAGTLPVGASTANRVELADAAVITDIEGPVVLSEEVNLVGTALNVTNAQPVTVEQGAYVLNGIGQADNFTNTITLVAPSAAGDLVYLMVATASSNLVAIADSGTVAASGGIELDGNDTAVLMAVDGSTWCLISESDN